MQAALLANGLSHEAAAWLADLHVRVCECEMALIKAGLAADKL